MQASEAGRALSGGEVQRRGRVASAYGVRRPRRRQGGAGRGVEEESPPRATFPQPRGPPPAPPALGESPCFPSGCGGPGRSRGRAHLPATRGLGLGLQGSLTSATGSQRGGNPRRVSSGHMPALRVASPRPRGAAARSTPRRACWGRGPTGTGEVCRDKECRG